MILFQSQTRLHYSYHQRRSLEVYLLSIVYENDPEPSLSYFYYILPNPLQVVRPLCFKGNGDHKHHFFLFDYTGSCQDSRCFDIDMVIELVGNYIQTLVRISKDNLYGTGTIVPLFHISMNSYILDIIQFLDMSINLNQDIFLMSDLVWAIYYSSSLIYLSISFV